MKKSLALLLAIIMCMGMFACAAPSGNGPSEPQEMAWTVKTATYTNPSGDSTVVYEAEYTDSQFVMSYLTERRKGEVDRESMVIVLENYGLSKIIEEQQDYGEDVDIRGETTFAYDEATQTLTETTMEDGRVDSQNTYVLTWDDQNRLLGYTKTDCYYYYDDNGVETERSVYEYEYHYTYGEDSFQFVSEQESFSYEDEQGRDVICVTTATVPYEPMGDITVTESYKTVDGVPICVDTYVDGEERKMEKTIATVNYWGYRTSETIVLDDGTQYVPDDYKPVFDEEGKVLNVERNGQQVAYTYDDNGNLVKLDLSTDYGISSITFEWMQIPLKLHNQLAMYSGSPHFSAAEYIDNHVIFVWEGRLTVRVYQKDAFLAYINE